MKNRSSKKSQTLKKLIQKSSQNIAKKVSVIGAGAWGLAISKLLVQNGHLVKVFSRDEVDTKKINENNLQHKVSYNLEEATRNADFIFIVVPSSAVLSILKSLSSLKISPKVKITICSKGIESKGLQLFSDCVKNELPKNKYAILSGPNFASEVAEFLPTVTTIASKDKKTALEISELLKNNNFLPIISDDVVTTQIFGSIKNIFAIGCGIIDGLKLGENAKAALVLKGVLEANLLIKKLGGKAEKNFISPCGLGDLFLTCSSKKSRNNSLGVLIGSGKKIADIVSSETTYEGFKASGLMIKFAKKHQITLPLCEKINQILQGDFSTSEIKNIISKTILSN